MKSLSNFQILIIHFNYEKVIKIFEKHLINKDFLILFQFILINFNFIAITIIEFFILNFLLLFHNFRFLLQISNFNL